MKLKKIVLISIILFSIFFIFFDYFNAKKIKKDIVPFTLEGKTYFVLKAETQEELKQGLMFVKKPVNYDGMLFLFPDKKIRSFWNKNTFLDLEIIWLDDDKIVGKDFLPSIEKSKEIIKKTSPAPVNRVLEIIK
jgi:uncharacterized membrane protein (UPF0127 family)